jgi:hypothetical protein
MQLMNLLNLTTNKLFKTIAFQKCQYSQGESRLPASRFTDLFMADASISFLSMPDDEKWTPGERKIQQKLYESTWHESGGGGDAENKLLATFTPSAQQLKGSLTRDFAK